MVWHAAIADVMTWLSHGRAGLLSPDELQRAARAARQTRQHELLASRALLRLALTSVQPTVEPSQWDLGSEPGGRPVVRGPLSGCHISLAHAGGIVACAVGPTDLGVDVEAQASTSTLDQAAETWLSARERDQMPHGDARHEWLGLRWTAKESVAKALGVGLTLDPCRIDVDATDWFRPPWISRFTCVVKDGGSAEGRLEGWHMRLDGPVGRYHLSVSVLRNAGDADAGTDAAATIDWRDGRSLLVG